MNIHDYTDYRSFLKDNLQEKKAKVSSRYTYERMAKACGIQKTYLSRVLNSSDAHLNEDQLFQCGAYLGLTHSEHRYLRLLRDYAKSHVAERRRELSVEIEEARSVTRSSESYLRAERVLQATELSDYYLDPNVMLVHIFLAVERFREDARRICKVLDISEEALTSILSKLERMQLISLDGDRYRLTKENTHLGVDSPLYRPYRFMQRLKTIERVQKLPKERTYNFSVVFSATESVRLEIQTKFLNLLQDVEASVTASPDQEVYQMNFDLFDWSRG